MEPKYSADEVLAVIWSEIAPYAGHDSGLLDYAISLMAWSGWTAELDTEKYDGPIESFLEAYDAEKGKRR